MMVEDDWTCSCGANLYWYEDYCGQCGKNRRYVLTQAQALAVARELAKLDRFERELRELTAAHAENLNRLLIIERQAEIMEGAHEAGTCLY